MESRRSGESAVVVSLDGKRSWKKSRSISGQWPNKPSKLGLYKSGHLFCNLTKLAVAVIGMDEGSNIGVTTTVVGIGGRGESSTNFQLG